jgi:hypothetical protein
MEKCTLASPPWRVRCGCLIDASGFLADTVLVSYQLSQVKFRGVVEALARGTEQKWVRVERSWD